MQITNLKDYIVPTGIKEIWPSEEKDFSPFIAEHLDEISNAIGIPLDTYILEKRVGRYEADIVTTISCDSESTAIIENKLNSFDHDHLGKAITYMSYLNAKCIIWICDSFYDEHVKAINYLNKITGDEYSFFGITVSVYKFDDNHYSYEFDVIAKPDYIEKSINSSLSEKSIETRTIYLDYWNKFKKSLTPELQNMIYIASRGQNYSFLNKKTLGNIGINISIGLKKNNRSARLQIFDKDDRLDELKEYLSQNIGLQFEKENGKRDKDLEYLYISQSYDDSPFDTLSWLSNTLIKTYNCLYLYINKNK